MNFSSIILLFVCVLPFAFSAPVLVTPSSESSTLQARHDDVDCKQIKRGDGGKFIIPKPNAGQPVVLGPFLNKCFKFTNLKDAPPHQADNGTNTVFQDPAFDCNAVAQGPADDGTFTVDASNLGSKDTASFAFSACLEPSA